MTPAGYARLKLDEGSKLQAYPDPGSPLAAACRKAGVSIYSFRAFPNWRAYDAKPWTVGYGCTGGGIGPETAWSQTQADAELLTRVAGFQGELRRALPWFDALAPVHKDVLVNIAFNVGVEGVLKWPATLEHMREGRWAQAAQDLRHEGRWNAQVGARAERLAVATETGEWA